MSSPSLVFALYARPLPAGYEVAAISGTGPHDIRGLWAYTVKFEEGMAIRSDQDQILPDLARGDRHVLKRLLEETCLIGTSMPPRLPDILAGTAEPITEFPDFARTLIAHIQPRIEGTHGSAVDLWMTSPDLVIHGRLRAPRAHPRTRPNKHAVWL